jgi:hypothetical protein
LAFGFSLPEGAIFEQTTTPSINQCALFCQIQALLLQNDTHPEIKTQPLDDGFPTFLMITKC